MSQKGSHGREPAPWVRSYWNSSRFSLSALELHWLSISEVVWFGGKSLHSRHTGLVFRGLQGPSCLTLLSLSFLTCIKGVWQLTSQPCCQDWRWSLQSTWLSIWHVIGTPQHHQIKYIFVSTERPWLVGSSLLLFSGTESNSLLPSLWTWNSGSAPLETSNCKPQWKSYSLNCTKQCFQAWFVSLQA